MAAGNASALWRILVLALALTATLAACGGRNRDAEPDAGVETDAGTTAEIPTAAPMPTATHTAAPPPTATPTMTATPAPTTTPTPEPAPLTVPLTASVVADFDIDAHLEPSLLSKLGEPIPTGSVLNVWAYHAPQQAFRVVTSNLEPDWLQEPYWLLVDAGHSEKFWVWRDHTDMDIESVFQVLPYQAAVPSVPDCWTNPERGGATQSLWSVLNDAYFLLQLSDDLTREAIAQAAVPDDEWSHQLGWMLVDLSNLASWMLNTNYQQTFPQLAEHLQRTGYHMGKGVALFVPVFFDGGDMDELKQALKHLEVPLRTTIPANEDPDYLSGVEQFFKSVESLFRVKDPFMAECPELHWFGNNFEGN